MKTYIIIILSCLTMLLLASCNHPQTIKKSAGPLDLSVTYLENGTQVTFQYHQDESYMAGQNNLEGTLYYYAATTRFPYASDIDMADSNGVWKGAFTLPDSAKAYAIKISSDEQLDNNKGKGYIFPVQDASGKPIPGALTAESNFYSGNGQISLGIKQLPDSVVALVERDHAIHPGIEKTWPEMYFMSLIQTKRISAYQSLLRVKRTSIAHVNGDSLIQLKMQPVYLKIRSELNEMLSRPNVSERNYMTAYFIYKYEMRMKSKADSLEKIMTQKYPAGLYVQQQYMAEFDTMIGQPDKIDSLGILYKQFKQRFHSGRNTANMLDRLAVAYAKAGKLDEFSHYVTQIPDKQQRAATYNRAAYELAMKGKELSFDSSASQKSLDLMKQLIAHPEQDRRPYDSKRDWIRLLRLDYGNYSDTYAMIMAKKGDLKDALTFQKTAVEYTKGDNPQVNERYAEYLVKSGNIDTAMTVIPKFIEKGKFTTKLTDYLKTAYTRKKGSDIGFKIYVDSLASIAGKRLKSKL